MTDLTDLHMYLKKMDEKLFRLENKVDNLNVKLEKLDRHIDFIDKTYDGLKGPISIASKFFKR